MSDTLNGKDKDEFTLIIGNREIVVDSAKFMRTIDTCADACNVTMPWEPNLDPALDDILKPNHDFPNAFVYLGGKLQMTGKLYNITQRRSNEGTIKELEIFTQTANMIDSTVRPPFEENNIDLYERCVNQAREFGIEVVKDSNLYVGGKFSRVTASQTDKCFVHLKDLAWQRGTLLSCTATGELEIILPNVDGQPVGTIEEKNPLTEVYEVSFNGRERFNTYEAIVSSSKKDKTKVKHQAIDEYVPANRFLTFKADESLPGEGLNAALWRRNKSAADSLNIQFPVNSWYAPNGQLFKPNTTITVVSDVLSLEKGFTFLISQVEFNYSSGGATAVLSLKPPSFYTLSEEIIEPWSE